MIITNLSTADQLIEVTPIRCQVLAARSFYERVLRCPIDSPYECCACAMLSRRHDRPCEMCGREAYRRARPTP